MDRACTASVSQPVGQSRTGLGIRLNRNLVLALLTYAAASAADYLLTLSGLMSREIRELNPILRAYIEHLGPAWGLMVPKLLLGLTAVFASTLYIHAMHQQKRTRVRAEHILYAGALFTALAPLHWVVLRYWF